MEKGNAIIFTIVAIVIIFFVIMLFIAASVDFDESTIFPSHDKTLVRRDVPA